MCWQPGNTIDDLEKDAIQKAYRFFGNNKTKTSQALGISIRTLDQRLAKYDGKILIEDKNERNTLKTISK